MNKIKIVEDDVFDELLSMESGSNEVNYNLSTYWQNEIAQIKTHGIVFIDVDDVEPDLGLVEAIVDYEIVKLKERIMLNYKNKTK